MLARSWTKEATESYRGIDQKAPENFQLSSECHLLTCFETPDRIDPDQPVLTCGPYQDYLLQMTGMHGRCAKKLEYQNGEDGKEKDKFGG